MRLMLHNDGKQKHDSYELTFTYEQHEWPVHTEATISVYGENEKEVKDKMRKRLKDVELQLRIAHLHFDDMPVQNVDWKGDSIA